MTVAPTAETATSTTKPVAQADGLELIGEFEDSGFVEPPWLVRLESGQTIQLTKLLFDVLASIDGRRDLDAVAAAASERYGKTASADDVRFLIEEKLRPLGVLKAPDGTNPDTTRPDPLLAIKGRFVLANERTTNAVTAPFQPLFFPPVVLAVVAGFIALLWWLFFAEGLASGARDLLYSPGMILLTFALTAASAGFHEFGHAAACRYGGGRPGVIGGGVYLVWPVFYTDVTDSYRLSRAGRLRTDLGGLYFNTVFALATLGVWFLTDFDALLVLVPLQLLQMTQQLMPFVRFDGYHILSDLTGVPDLFARIKPTVAAAIPGKEPDARASQLKPWVRVVVTVWVVLVIPVLLVSLTLAVVGLPRLLATVGDSIGRQWNGVSAGLESGDFVRVIAGALGAVAVALPAASVVFILARLVRRIGQAAWSRTDGRPFARAALVPGLAVAAAGLAWLWWPNGEYEPLRRGERWTVQETVGNLRHVPTGRPGLATDVTTTTAVSTTTTTQLESRTGADDTERDTSETTDAPSRSTTTTTEESETTETTSP